MSETAHRPWPVPDRPWPRPLQDAEAELREHSLAPDGLKLDGEPLLHAERQDVVIWPLERVEAAN